jgi:uncharacterized protein (UPF0335 family)
MFDQEQERRQVQIENSLRETLSRVERERDEARALAQKLQHLVDELRQELTALLAAQECLAKRVQALLDPEQ